MPVRIGSDIGGTFTDLVIADGEGRLLHRAKVLTTPENPERAVLAGVDELLGKSGAPGGSVQQLLHATTLFTNALIERKGSRTALITTTGFRDAIEIGREHRYDMYDLYLKRPRPLAERRLRFEIDGRILVDGSELEPLDEAQIPAIAEAIRKEGVEAVAICLINSYVNQTHETRLKELLQIALPDIAITASSELVAEIGEYDRSSTALANVYVQRIAERYMQTLESALTEKGIGGRLLIMQSNGGLCTADSAARHPIKLVESGPAAGAIAAAYYGSVLGHDKLLSFDMGGTTAKACIVLDGKPLIAPTFEIDRQYKFKKGSGLPVKVPVVELIEIGTGGGSIASLDPLLGRMAVGPRSAGSVPGPACYGLGGKEPTVTDSDLILGYLDADFFLGGSMKLDRAAAETAIAGRIGDRLDMSVARAAWAIHQMANESMASAARIHAVERGANVENFPIFAFGGAGPVHAYGVARILRSPSIIYPLGAGVMSAIGLLVAPVTFDFVRTLTMPLAQIDWSVVAALFGDMEGEGKALIEGVVPAQQVRYRRVVDMRYRNQGSDIRIEIPDLPFGPELEAVLKAEFLKSYRRIYGHLIEDATIECVSWRAIVHGPSDAVSSSGSLTGQGSLEEARKGTRRIYLPDIDDYGDVPVFDRNLLPLGASFAGPAIVEETESTAVIAGPAQISVDMMGNLVAVLAGRK